MAGKRKRNRIRNIRSDDLFMHSQAEDGSGLALSAWTESGYQYVVNLSGLDPYNLVWMVEKLSARAAYLLKVEREGQLSLERRMQAAAKRVSDATKGGA